MIILFGTATSSEAQTVEDDGEEDREAKRKRERQKQNGERDLGF